MANWDFRNNHVQEGIDKVAFPTAETILLSAGKASFDENSTAATVTAGADGGINRTLSADFQALGLIENFAINQNMGNSKIFEVGSSRSYVIPGKYTGAMNLSRVLGFEDSLLKLLWKKTSVAQALASNVAALPSNSLPGAKDPSQGDNATEQLWMNIGSHIFLEQIGILFWIVSTVSKRIEKGADETVSPITIADLSDDYGAFYLEYGTLTGHQFGANAGAVVLMENVGLMFERMVPVSVTAGT